MRTIIKSALLLCLSAVCFGQVKQQVCPQKFDVSTNVSGTVLTIPNDCGGLVLAASEEITGAPSTMSAVIAGCPRGTSPCTVLDTNTATTSTQRKPTLDTVYDYFTVTPTWTGGTAPIFTVRSTITPVGGASSSGGGSSAAIGATGAAVPTSANYEGLNVAGNLRGQTGSNPSGGNYAAHTDVIAFNGAAFSLYATLLNGVAATGTATGAAVRSPQQSASGILSITGTGITGSPVGCQIALSAQQNTGGPIGTAFATQAFTPANSYQSFAIVPANSTAALDAIVAAFSCATTYPTAGTLTVVFSPLTTATLPANQAAAGASAASISLQAGGVYNSSAPTPSTGQQEPLQLDAAARLQTNDNLNTILGNPIIAAASGVQRVGISGSAAGVLDGAVNTAVPGNVLAVGTRTQTSGASGTAGTTNRSANPLSDLTGQLFVIPGGSLRFSAFITLSTNTTTQIFAAPAAGMFAFVTDIKLFTTTAGTATSVTIEYGTGTNCATAPTALTPGISNTTIGITQLDFTMPLVPAAANAICAVQAGTTAGTTGVLITGYVIP